MTVANFGNDTKIHRVKDNCFLGKNYWKKLEDISLLQCKLYHSENLFKQDSHYKAVNIRSHFLDVTYGYVTT